MILVSLQNLCDKKAATALAQSGTSIMVVFLFDENIVGDMAASHQAKKNRIRNKLQVAASLKPPTEQMDL